jgi:membrane protein YqaA with SNARE-associated domain
MAVVSPQALKRYWQPTVTYCRPRILPALLLVGVLVLSAALVFVPIDWKMFGVYGGYLGIFLVTLLATGAIILPVPYLGLIVNAGASPYLNPLLVALIAGVAAALGEMTGYLVGYTGRALLPRNRWFDAVHRGVTRFGGPVIFLAAAIPNPFFDAVGIVAGATRLSVWLFLGACFLGKTIRFFLLVKLGQSLLGGG